MSALAENLKQDEMISNEEYSHQQVKPIYAKFQTILPIIVNNKFVDKIDASSLHNALEIDTKPSIWLKRQLVNSPYFQEGLDYFITESSRGSAGGSPKKIYEITLPTAKKLAMLSSTNRGSQLPPTKDGGFRARK